MSAVAEALEALGHTPGALPEPRRLAELFVRFQAQVPLRHSSEGFAPEAHLASWLEEGSGLCGGSRVAAFAALAGAAGFALERAVACHGSGASRPVLLADEGRLLLDAAFPFPAPLSLDPPTVAEATGYGALSVTREDDGSSAVLLETRGDERLLYRVGRARVVKAETPNGRPGKTRPVGAGTGGGDASTGLFRLHEDRLLRWEDGVLEITDSWSRLRIPFPSSDADGLEALFGPPVPPPATPVPAGEKAVEPSLAVYLASSSAPATLLTLLGEPERHAAILPDGWSPEGVTRREDGFAWELREKGELLRRERLRFATGEITVEADGPLALFATRTFRLEPRPAGTRLRLLATFRDPISPRGLPESTRRRLVFELASELLSLDRCAAPR